MAAAGFWGSCGSSPLVHSFCKMTGHTTELPSSFPSTLISSSLKAPLDHVQRPWKLALFSPFFPLQQLADYSVLKGFTVTPIIEAQNKPLKGKSISLLQEARGNCILFGLPSAVCPVPKATLAQQASGGKQLSVVWFISLQEGGPVVSGLSIIICHLQIAHKKPHHLDVMLEERGWLFSDLGCGQRNLSKGISINVMIGEMKEGGISHRLFLFGFTFFVFKVKRLYFMGTGEKKKKIKCGFELYFFKNTIPTLK